MLRYETVDNFSKIVQAALVLSLNGGCQSPFLGDFQRRIFESPHSFNLCSCWSVFFLIFLPFFFLGSLSFGNAFWNRQNYFLTVLDCSLYYGNIVKHLWYTCTLDINVACSAGMMVCRIFSGTSGNAKERKPYWGFKDARMLCIKCKLCKITSVYPAGYKLQPEFTLCDNHMDNYCENYICPTNLFSLQQIINSMWFKFAQLIAGTKIVTQTPDVTQNKYLW